MMRANSLAPLQNHRDCLRCCMKRFLLCLSLVVTAIGTPFICAAQAEANAMEALKRAQKAQIDAPACRMKIISTDAENKSSTMTLEFVKPDLMHWKMEENSQVKMEMWSDGKKTFMRKGSAGEIKEAPLNMSAMITKARESASVQALMGMAKELKFVGHEAVSGTPASAYTFKTEMMGLNSAVKLWISDVDNRPLKSEGETHGEIKIGTGPGRATNKKSVTTFEYDPSIKVIMPVK
jgi:outer membrane lipoprotein-sorting protein